MADSVPALLSVPLPADLPAEAVPVPDSSVSEAGSDASPNRTTQLYRAALGPVNTGRYLRVFERFDAAGRRRPVWHSAAGVFTLGWLVFRRLWLEALGYGVLMGVVAGLCVWAWPTIEAWPPGVRWGLLGAWLLASTLPPGLAGYGLVHRQVQWRLLRAVAAARSVDDACIILARQAATRRRLWLLVAAYAAVWLLFAGWMWGRSPASNPSSAALVRADVPVLAPSSPVPPPTPLPAPTLEPETPVLSATVEPAAVIESVEPVSVESKPVAQAPAAPPVPAPPVPVQATPTPSGTFAINVGLFAVADNAQRARERLARAGLPVTLEEIATSKGLRSRVRVGPFDERADADAAAERVHALGLEAVVFRR